MGLRSKTPGLLQRMIEHKVGELVVRRDRIIEPCTDCRVASGFPSTEAAIAAATEMNEVADWFGVIKTRAEGRRPNCQDELRQIAERHGGKFGDGGKGFGVDKLCAQIVAAVERS